MATAAAAAAMEEPDVVNGRDVVSWVASGVVLWSTAFLLVRALFPKRSYDFCNRAVSTMHAVAAVCLACLSVDDWSCPVCPLAAASSPRQMKALAVTLAYMVYDAACCHLNGDTRLDNAVHHLVSIVGIGAGLAYQRPTTKRTNEAALLPLAWCTQCGTEMVASMLVTEMSSPLLHLREMLKELGVRDTELNLLVDVLFAATFSAARMGVGPYLTYVTVTADNPILIKVYTYTDYRLRSVRQPNKLTTSALPPTRRWRRGCSW
uniref:TLC domain-containing protein n=1 Tax=Zea mays TaxID=4577 RepID=A0A804UF75_MAIZE